MRIMKIPKIKKFKLSQLTAADYNPRVIDDNAIEGLANSISRFGCVEPIVVNVRGGTNTIIGGHQRYRALEGLGVKDVICVTVSCSKADEKLLNLSLNNPAIQGQFIKDIGEYIEKLRAEIGDDTDYLALRINELRGEIEETKEGLTEDDYVPEPPKKPKSKRGDLYILGNHRLLCGDATSEKDFKRLMGKEKADMVFTDPPYGIDVVGKEGTIGKGVKCKEGHYRPMYNDNEPFDPEFLFGMSKRIFVFGANYYAKRLPETGRWLVWDKNRPAGSSFSDCEIMWCSDKGVAVKKYKCTWVGMRQEGKREKRVHPAQKPVGLLEQLFVDFQFKDCIDPFLGSGSTIIAAEKLNRRCFGLEIDPIYCDVIVKRWEDFTGKKAKLKKPPQRLSGVNEKLTTNEHE